ncbi:MAG: Hpt protein [Clostridia bacterium]|jgi:HPt (histidine-containing phosphotransfer) domain-containing protein|nr:Hpt protein [Clostridia bacterium]
MKDDPNNCVEMFMKNTGLDLEDAAELYTVFLAELDSEMKEVKSFFNRGDFKNVQKVVHNIKGISSNYLALSVYKIAQEIDAQLKEDITENIAFKIISLDNEADTIKSTIITLFRNMNITLEV